MVKEWEHYLVRQVFSFFMICIFRRIPSLQSTKPNSRGNTSKTTVHQLTNRVYQSSFATDQPPEVLNQLSSKIHQPALGMHQISAGICKSTAEIRPSFTGSSTYSFIPLEPGSETKWNQSEDEFFEHDELDYLVSTKLKCIWYNFASLIGLLTCQFTKIPFSSFFVLSVRMITFIPFLKKWVPI